jgi:hypothetical protein
MRRKALTFSTFMQGIFHKEEKKDHFIRMIIGRRQESSKTIPIGQSLNETTPNR